MSYPECNRTEKKLPAKDSPFNFSQLIPTIDAEYYSDDEVSLKKVNHEHNNIDKVRVEIKQINPIQISTQIDESVSPSTSNESSEASPSCQSLLKSDVISQTNDSVALRHVHTDPINSCNLSTPSVSGPLDRSTHNTHNNTNTTNTTNNTNDTNHDTINTTNTNNTNYINISNNNHENTNLHKRSLIKVLSTRNIINSNNVPADYIDSSDDERSYEVPTERDIPPRHNSAPGNNNNNNNNNNIHNKGRVISTISAAAAHEYGLAAISTDTIDFNTTDRNNTAQNSINNNNTNNNTDNINNNNNEFNNYHRNRLYSNNSLSIASVSSDDYSILNNAISIPIRDLRRVGSIMYDSPAQTAQEQAIAYEYNSNNNSSININKNQQENELIAQYNKFYTQLSHDNMVKIEYFDPISTILSERKMNKSPLDSYYNAALGCSTDSSVMEIVETNLHVVDKDQYQQIQQKIQLQKQQQQLLLQQQKVLQQQQQQQQQQALEQNQYTQAQQFLSQQLLQQQEQQNNIQQQQQAQFNNQQIEQQNLAQQLHQQQIQQVQIDRDIAKQEKQLLIDAQNLTVIQNNDAAVRERLFIEQREKIEQARQQLQQQQMEQEDVKQLLQPERELQTASEQTSDLTENKLNDLRTQYRLLAEQQQLQQLQQQQMLQPTLQSQFFAPNTTVVEQTNNSNSVVQGSRPPLSPLNRTSSGIPPVSQPQQYHQQQPHQARQASPPLSTIEDKIRERMNASNLSIHITSPEDQMIGTPGSASPSHPSRHIRHVSERSQSSIDIANLIAQANEAVNNTSAILNSSGMSVASGPTHRRQLSGTSLSSNINSCGVSIAGGSVPGTPSSRHHRQLSGTSSIGVAENVVNGGHRRELSGSSAGAAGSIVSPSLVNRELSGMNGGTSHRRGLSGGSVGSYGLNRKVSGGSDEFSEANRGLSRNSNLSSPHSASFYQQQQYGHNSNNNNSNNNNSNNNNNNSNSNNNNSKNNNNNISPATSPMARGHHRRQQSGNIQQQFTFNATDFLEPEIYAEPSVFNAANLPVRNSDSRSPPLYGRTAGSSPLHNRGTGISDHDEDEKSDSDEVNYGHNRDSGISYNISNGNINSTSNSNGNTVVPLTRRNLHSNHQSFYQQNTSNLNTTKKNSNNRSMNNLYDNTVNSNSNNNFNSNNNVDNYIPVSHITNNINNNRVNVIGVSSNINYGGVTNTSTNQIVNGSNSTNNYILNNNQQLNPQPNHQQLQHQHQSYQQHQSQFVHGKQYVRDMYDTRSPDDKALELGILLSTQEAKYCTTMFDFITFQHENEVSQLVGDGFSRETAYEIVFDRYHE